MAVYVGVMSDGLKVENGKLVGSRGGSVGIFCNNLKRSDGFVVGPVFYNISFNFLEIDRVLPSYKSVDGTFLPITYGALIREFSKDSGKNPLVVLMDSGSISGGKICLCGEYPNRELVAGARVSDRSVLDNLINFGKNFV